ncbi:hypothetical protein BJ170DRAFT_592651 [Xylariales sp. AK1849]|nr:hypothetical protein BJ170DRAFT_592651 [Xylariales sp. AK1849]
MPPVEREPRAALILNRFTRPLSIMYATDSVAQILGLGPNQIKHKSFYQCIAQNCLGDAVKCLESAKANDSIAYLRFWFRDPRQDDNFDGEENEDAGPNTDGDGTSSSDSEGGVQLDTAMDIDSDRIGNHDIKTEPGIKTEPLSPDLSKAEVLRDVNGESSASSSTGLTSFAGASSLLQTPTEESPPAVPPASASADQHRLYRHRRRQPMPTFELEAVVSCTSDGLVVVLRRARPPIPAVHPPALPVGFENGLFAAPWGQQPVNPYFPPELYHDFRPPLMPQYMPLQEHVKAAGGPPIDQLMRSIRDVAVFAWALVGINGNFASHGHGIPHGEAQPPDGLPIWDPSAGQGSYLGPSNQAAQRWSQAAPDSHKGKAAAAFGTSYVPRFPADPSEGYSSTSATLNNMSDTYSQYDSPGLYAHAVGSQHAFGHPQQLLQPSPTYHGDIVQDPWADTAAQYTHGDYPAPTSQASSPGDGAPHYSHRWH